MHTENDAIVAAFSLLNPLQILWFKNLVRSERIMIPDEDFVSSIKNKLIKSKEGCPSCGSLRTVKNGINRLKKQCYKCKTCGRNFCESTYSLLSYSKKPVQKWLEYMECMSGNLSIRDCAKKVCINRNTAFQWRHKILHAVKNTLEDSLTGIIEADEIAVTESFKGNHSLKKNFSPGRTPRQRGLSMEDKKMANKVNILCCKDRTGTIFSSATGFRKANCSVLCSLLDIRIPKGSILCTNNNPSFIGLARKLKLKLYRLRHRNEAKQKIYHRNNVRTFEEEFLLFLQRFNGVATKYLNHYINWAKWLDLISNLKDYISFAAIYLLCISNSRPLRICDLKTVTSIP
jgi:transposase-like protein